MNIIEFLEARISEDEAQAEYVQSYGDCMTPTGGYALFTPHRALAECAAKRAIIKQYQSYVKEAAESVGIAFVGARGGQEVTSDALKALTAVYSDHPDYQQEWAA